jgi:membrane-associated phospholipid phosphatase
MVHFSRLCKISCVGVLGSVLCASKALAQTSDAPQRAEREQQRLHWEPYRRVQPLEYVITFGTPIALRVLNGATHEASAPRWRGPILFDATARDLLRADSVHDRDLAARLSDVGWYGVMAWPFVDAVVVSLAIDQNPDVAWQLSLLTLQAYALSGFISLTAIRAFARERPADQGCEGRAPECDQPPRSFPSGHTAGVFAGAGLVCASHTHLPLYGGGVADHAACVSALSVGAVTAALRVTADRHYASDVLVGASIGLTVGWLMPALLHYGVVETPAGSLQVLPSVAGSPGLALAGLF